LGLTFGISHYLELFCFLSFVTFVLCTVEPRLSRPWLSGLFDYLDFILVRFFSCIDCRKQPNSPFKRLLKQRIIPYAFQIRKCDEIKNYLDAFSWYMIGSIIFVAKGISCLISSFRVGYRAIDRKLKPKTCLRSESELFYRLKISK